jgi:hypothetical protein
MSKGGGERLSTERKVVRKVWAVTRVAVPCGNMNGDRKKCRMWNRSEIEGDNCLCEVCNNGIGVRLRNVLECR